MKVLLINGSPDKNGCTFASLSVISGKLADDGIDSDIFWIGNKPINGCIDCHKCKTIGQCAFNDSVNEFLRLADKCDGFIFGTPVHYAGSAGPLITFMTRVFFADLHSGKNRFYLKPAAAIAAARRAGAVNAIDQIVNFFLWAYMPVVSSRYWNAVYGQTPEEILADSEGIRNLNILSENMAWMLRCIEAGKKAGVNLPDYS